MTSLAATGMKWIEVKMRELGVERNPNYKITFYLDSSAMISVHTQKYGFVDVSYHSFKLKINKFNNYFFN